MRVGGRDDVVEALMPRAGRGPVLQLIARLAQQLLALGAFHCSVPQSTELAGDRHNLGAQMAAVLLSVTNAAQSRIVAARAHDLCLAGPTALARRCQSGPGVPLPGAEAVLVRIAPDAQEVPVARRVHAAELGRLLEAHVAQGPLVDDVLLNLRLRLEDLLAIRPDDAPVRGDERAVRILPDNDLPVGSHHRAVWVHEHAPGQFLNNRLLLPIGHLLQLHNPGVRLLQLPQQIVMPLFH
mmetsp:Transcript_34843/g.58206  ORF Transcript_34843/g.58206 Transcript_34843/m.58206 type:complete len:239 (+) Transcript_34843:1786-2502(+)